MELLTLIFYTRCTITHLAVLMSSPCRVSSGTVIADVLLANAVQEWANISPCQKNVPA